MTLNLQIEFYNYLDKFDDFAGKYIIDTIEDLVFLDADGREEILEQVTKLLWERVDQFYKFQALGVLDQNDECLRALGSKAVEDPAEFYFKKALRKLKIPPRIDFDGSPHPQGA